MSLTENLLGLDYFVRNKLKSQASLTALALQRQASAKGWERDAAVFLGRKIQFLASFLYRDLPLLHFLHLEINEFKSHHYPLVNTELEVSWGDDGVWSTGVSLRPAAAPGLVMERRADLGSRFSRTRED